MDLISELKRKQQKEPLIYESDRDGAIEDIITGENIHSQTSVFSLYCVILFLFLPHSEGSAASWQLLLPGTC